MWLSVGRDCFFPDLSQIWTKQQGSYAQLALMNFYSSFSFTEVHKHLKIKMDYLMLISPSSMFSVYKLI